jgi:hypothetical protein
MGDQSRSEGYKVWRYVERNLGVMRQTGPHPPGVVTLATWRMYVHMFIQWGVVGAGMQLEKPNFSGPQAKEAISNLLQHTQFKYIYIYNIEQFLSNKFCVIQVSQKRNLYTPRLIVWENLPLDIPFTLTKFSSETLTEGNLNKSIYI